jgi:CSLREA domain-containing protein
MRRVVALTAIASASLVFAAEAGATVIRVNTTSDDSLFAAKCSLRNAVKAANSDTAVGSCQAGNGRDQIVLPAGFYILIYSPGDDTAAQGDLDVASDLSITGAGTGKTIIDGGGKDRVFDVLGSASATISRLTVQHGLTPGLEPGGGIRLRNTAALTVSHVVVRENMSARGGGIANFSTGLLKIVSSTLSGNTANADAGGGVFNAENTSLDVSASRIIGNEALAPGQDVGGGVENLGDATITTSTIANNETPAGGGGGLATVLGTLTMRRTTVSGNRSLYYGAGLTILSGPVTIVNSTISGNVQLAGYGAGVYVDGGPVTFTSLTIAFNHLLGDQPGGGIRGDVTMKDTIVAKNTAASHPDCDGTVTSLGHNLVGKPGGCAGLVASDIRNKDARLGPLRRNGGPTATHALLVGSPAIDHGKGCPAIDQRGVKRPQGPRCDIGAYERRV